MLVIFVNIIAGNITEKTRQNDLELLMFLVHTMAEYSNEYSVMKKKKV